ncbi:MaoC family dehydratase [Methylotenera sp. N17]|uniref:MaoC family dehydratase n=1 Tax=Methylotenera sp. N17 TaxID=1502761 RepID=UPI00064644F0|nr:MaoC family dehydratase [Methylotenera sp. N17]
MTHSNKIHHGRYFEDFTLNEVIQHATPRTITQGDTALYIALTGERNPLFCSEPFAQSLGYKTMPVDDLLAFHIAFGKTVPDISVNAVANLGYADVRFLQPVFVGDTLSTSSQVIGLKQNSNGNSGVVWVRSTSVNQNNMPVISWVRWVMVHKKNEHAPAPDTVIPTLPEYVPADQLSIPNDFCAHNEISVATGGQYFWEDYQIGERIHHPSGLTINESDHTLATHLYQNNARLHFDAHMMKDSVMGKRLVYGGIVISACRAMSYEGLENVLSVLAINGGTHANPCFAGDTIYTLTEVLDAWALPNRSDVGALRLRMVGLKNCGPVSFEYIKKDTGYHTHVLLDLDYTVLIPRREQ